MLAPPPSPIVAKAPVSPITVVTQDLPVRQTIATQVVVNNDQNGLGTAAFVTSIVALFTGGCLSPLSLVFALVAMSKRPRGMAVAGLCVSCVGIIPMALISIPILAAIATVGEAQKEIEKQQIKDAAIASAVHIIAVKQHPRANAYSEPPVEFTVRNSSKIAISHLHVQFDFIIPGRSVPAASDSMSGGVPGGIEPGESKTLTWIPGYGSRGLHNEVPANAIGKGSVLSVRDADSNIY